MTTDQRSKGALHLVAAFPLSEGEIAVVASHPLDASMQTSKAYALSSGLDVRAVAMDRASPKRVVLRVEGMRPLPFVEDRVTVRNLKSPESEAVAEATSPPFLHGLLSPLELKVPHLSPRYPYESTLVDRHVTVMCCTGCNGGIHDRDLVVVNSHAGGAWSGVWVQTAQGIETPYPRWQRVTFAGGVIAEQNGSMTVVDRGWMIVRKGNEKGHHAPPPLPIETADLPVEATTSLLAKGLDASWVQFTDPIVESVRPVPAREQSSHRGNLPYLEVVLTDKSGGHSAAWLYQSGAAKLRPGDHLAALRGFVHAEGPGHYVLLSDKNEDLIMDRGARALTE